MFEAQTLHVFLLNLVIKYRVDIIDSLINYK